MKVAYNRQQLCNVAAYKFCRFNFALLFNNDLSSTITLQPTYWIDDVSG
jgi:hypothetical protein